MTSKVRCHSERVSRSPEWNEGEESKFEKNLLQEEAGMTLIELIVVLVIIGIISAIVLPRFMDAPEKGKRAAAKTQIGSFEQALQMYKLDNGVYPGTEQGLTALVEKPGTGELVSNWKEGGYLGKKEIPKDPWGNPYIYISPGAHNPDFDLLCYGKDGQEGGEGDNKDINSWSND
ncbi:type II secretion system major pseudopilin GspG [Candidatus Poribacteria bacterium]|nr:type II secretion system major pseudopilin GspG [Candidatus Poribacteria bacterium]